MGLLNHVFNNKKNIIFGTGDSGRQAFELLENIGLDTDYFLDNNNSKWGTSYFNRSIKRPECLYHENKANIMIIIASMYDEEIAEQLMNMGFEKYIHFVSLEQLKNPFLLSGNVYQCPFCYGNFDFLYPTGLRHDVLFEKKIIGGGFRTNAVCPECFSFDRERLVFLYLNQFTDVFEKNLSSNILHIAPERNLGRVLKETYKDSYISGDINPEKAVYKVDLLDIPFKDNYFDFIICNHVLEHIIDDIKAMSELYRVMKPNGTAILQVPISWDMECTFEDSTITQPTEREVIFGQSDHVRIYGKDYITRLQSVGFNVEVLECRELFDEETIKKYALNPVEKIFMCKK